MIAVLLGVVTVSAHLWNLSGEFSYDDYIYIVENQAVQAGASGWPRFFTDSATYSALRTPHYRPLVTLSYALNVSMDMGMAGFRLTQLLFHLLTVFGVFRVLSLVRRELVDMPGTVPFVAAAWVGIVPFNVDAIHYLTARSSVLCGMFVVASIGCYLKMRLAKVRGDVGLFYVLHLAFLVAAAMCKETALATPAVIVAVDLLLVRRARPELKPFSPAFLWPYLPYLLGGAGAFALSPNVRNLSFHFLKFVYEPWRIAAAIYCLVENVRLMLLPTGLSISHPIGEGIRVADLSVLARGAVIVGVAVVAWRVRRMAPVVTFGLLWYFLFIGPSTFVHLKEILHEHRGYTASIGVGIVVAWLAGVLWERLDGRRRTAGAVLAAMAAVLLLSMTVDRQQVWANEFALWTDSLRVHPDNPVAYSRAGVYHMVHGDLATAEYMVQRAIVMDPYDVSLVRQLAIIYRKGEQWDRAEKMYWAAYDMAPEKTEALQHLILMYELSEQPERLISVYRKLLTLRPAQAAEIHLAMASVYARAGNRPEARSHLDRVLEMAGEIPAQAPLAAQARALRNQLDAGDHAGH